jgi:hypothetical protein
VAVRCYGPWRWRRTENGGAQEVLLFALFYDESVRDPIIVVDIERQRVLDGQIRDVRYEET